MGAEKWPSVDVLRKEGEHFRATELESLSASKREFLKDLLWNDASTEYDARFLTAWLHTEEPKRGPFSKAFWVVHDLWSFEEERHYRGLFAVLAAVFPETDWRARLNDRVPSFDHLESSLPDEFSVLVTGAFDELVTVRAYRANLDVYGKVGPEFSRFVKLMIADEALHYARFLGCLKAGNQQRSAEASAVIRSVRLAAAGSPYGATFLLDYDAPEYTDTLLAKAESILVANL